MLARSLGPDAELSLLEERDAEALFALVDSNRAHLRRWLSFVDGSRSVEDVRAFIRGSLDRLARNDGLNAGIWAGSELAGVIGLHYVNRANRRSSFGYWIGESYQGRGLVTRASEALLDYCFEDLGLNRMEVACATGNERSRHVIERLGFRHEGIARDAEWLYDHFVDHHRFGLLAREWRERPDVRPRVDWRSSKG